MDKYVRRALDILKVSAGRGKRVGNDWKKVAS